MVEALIFDYGGVISDGGRDFEPSIRLANNLDIDQTRADQLIATPWDLLCKGMIDVSSFWANIEDILGYKVTDEKKDIWNTFETCMFPRPEIFQTLINLKAAGYILGLLSDTVPPTAHSIRSNGGYDPFDFAILSCEVGFRKPDARIYEITLSKINDLGPGNVAFIDDNPNNLEPARKLGMQTIHAGQSEELISQIFELVTL